MIKKEKNEIMVEMLLTCPVNIVAYDGNPKGLHLYAEQRHQIAEAYFNAGYRKVGDGDVLLTKVDMLKYAKDCLAGETTGLDIINGLIARAERKAEQARKKATKEILQILIQYGDRDEALRRHILDMADDYGVSLNKKK